MTEENTEILQDAPPKAEQPSEPEHIHDATCYFHEIDQDCYGGLGVEDPSDEKVTFWILRRAPGQFELCVRTHGQIVRFHDVIRSV